MVVWFLFFIIFNPSFISDQLNKECRFLDCSCLNQLIRIYTCVQGILYKKTENSVNPDLDQNCSQNRASTEMHILASNDQILSVYNLRNR